MNNVLRNPGQTPGFLGPSCAPFQVQADPDPCRYRAEVLKMPGAASRLKCQNNLKQRGLAWHNYHDVNNLFPPGGMCVGVNRTFDWTVEGDKGSWHAFVLPYMEQDHAFKALPDFSVPSSD